jgi:hypothetical protein
MSNEHYEVVCRVLSFRGVVLEVLISLLVKLRRITWLRTLAMRSVPVELLGGPWRTERIVSVDSNEDGPGRDLDRDRDDNGGLRRRTGGCPI